MRFFKRPKKVVYINLDPNYRYGVNDIEKELVGVHVTVWPLSPKSGVPNNLMYVPTTPSTPSVLAQRAEERARHVACGGDCASAEASASSGNGDWSASRRFARNLRC